MTGHTRQHKNEVKVPLKNTSQHNFGEFFDETDQKNDTLDKRS